MKLSPRSGESEFVACIERNREVIVATAMGRSLPPERHSVLADALANRTLDYLMGALTSGSEDNLISWVISSVRGFASEQTLFDLFASTVSAALDVLLNELGHVASGTHQWLETVQRRIDLCASASRIEFHHERFALDSVDAKIDEVLYRLSERDTSTAEHSRSVGMWCWRIARQLGFSREDALLAARSGLIHDIGKIATPLEILTAPRALDAEEWEIMKQHSMEGVKVIEAVPELRAFVPAVRWHHERVDGRGYPDRLEGASIPLTARIVAVADAFNAMVARRPYRAPRSPSFAIEELRRHSGAHFDPSIVTAMIDVVLQERL